MSKDQTTANPLRKPWPLDIRRNEDGSLDEIVCDGASIHLEQMSDTHWWMSIEKDGKLIHINFSSARKILVECDDAG